LIRNRVLLARFSTDTTVARTRLIGGCPERRSDGSSPVARRRNPPANGDSCQT